MAMIPWLRSLHILAMAVAFGANATYGAWIALASRGTDTQLAWVLRCLERVDTWVANGAWWVAAATGAALAWSLGMAFTTPWLALSIALFAVAMAVAYLAYTPTLKAQIEVLEREGRSASYARVAGRAQALGILMFVLAFVIYGLMVTRPTF